MGVSNFAADFGLGNQGGDGVDHNDVKGVGADEHFNDVEGLFTAVRLGEEQGFEVNTDAFGPGGIEGVFGIDEGSNTVIFLSLGDHVQGQGGFAAGFGSEQFDNASSRNATATQGQIQREGAGADTGDVGDGVSVQVHDDAFSELLFDLGEGAVKVAGNWFFSSF